MIASPLFLIRFLAVGLSIFSGLSLTAALTIRGGVESAGAQSGAALFDLNPGSLWTATAAGQQASVLLEDTRLMDAAAIVYASETGACQLMGSDNYRDWWLLAAAEAPPLEGRVVESAFPALPIRYLRFRSTGEGSGQWASILAGTASEVADDLESFQPYDWGDVTDPMVIETMMAAAFDWQWDRVVPTAENLDWLHGAFHTGISAAYQRTGDSRYREAIFQVGEHANWILRRRTGGKGWYHGDDHCMGQTWLEMYLTEPDPQALWIADVKMRMDWVMADPLPGRQDYSWCDALFMAPPVYVRLAEATGDDAYRTFIDGQWWDATDFLYDPTWQLYYRDAGYFDDREANGMPVFWSRGNGWVMGGLVRMLTYMPTDWSTRSDYIDLLTDMASRIRAIQDPVDGLWRSSLLYPERFGNEPEASGSAFFVYAIAWAINEGILDAATYGPVVEAGWAGLASLLARDGEVRYIQQVGAAPALNNQQSDRREYGYGAFLLAATEMARYYTAGTTRTHSEVILETRLARPDPGSPQPVRLDATSWERVDDFTETSGWTTAIRETGTGALAASVADPFVPTGSAVLRVWGGNGSNNIMTHRSIPPVSNGQVATVYQRFAVDDSILDTVFGVSDVTGFSGYPDYETGVRFYYQSNRFEVRSGSSYVEVSDDFVQLQTWYEVWTVIDNASDTYDVYVRGGSNFPEQTLLRENIPFRNGTSQAIVRYAIAVNPNAGLSQSRGSIYLDDLYMDRAGINLARPEGVDVPRYSPWSALPCDPVLETKETALGEMQDEHFPWIYHRALAGWLFVAEPDDLEDASRWGWSPWAGWLFLHASADTRIGSFVYAYADAAWWFLPRGLDDWYYDYGDARWRRRS